MRHLSPEELLDYADSSTPPSNAHLASCETCRQQLADLHAFMGTVTGVEVPEPSPLFWEHLSARVREAIAEERSPKRGWLTGFTGFTRFAGWRFIAPLSAAAVATIVLVAIVSPRFTTPQAPSSNTAASLPATEGVNGGSNVEPSAGAVASVPVDDPIFNLVSDLTADIDIDTALAAGLATQGGADEAVNHLTGSELNELERLLNEEMARSKVAS